MPHEVLPCLHGFPWVTATCFVFFSWTWSYTLISCLPAQPKYQRHKVRPQHAVFFDSATITPVLSAALQTCMTETNKITRAFHSSRNSVFLSFPPPFLMTALNVWNTIRLLVLHLRILNAAISLFTVSEHRPDVGSCSSTGEAN